MKSCHNCHQKKEQLNKDNLCEDCFDAKYADGEFKPVYDYNLGKTNLSRKVKE